MLDGRKLRGNSLSLLSFLPQGFQQKFAFHSKEIVAISCSWCKQAVSKALPECLTGRFCTNDLCFLLGLPKLLLCSLPLTAPPAGRSCTMILASSFEKLSRHCLPITKFLHGFIQPSLHWHGDLRGDGGCAQQTEQLSFLSVFSLASITAKCHVSCCNTSKSPAHWGLTLLLLFLPPGFCGSGGPR